MKFDSSRIDFLPVTTASCCLRSPLSTQSLPCKSSMKSLSKKYQAFPDKNKLSILYFCVCVKANLHDAICSNNLQDLHVVTTSFLWLPWLRLVRFLRSHDAMWVVCYKLLLKIASCKLAFSGLNVNGRHRWSLRQDTLFDVKCKNCNFTKLSYLFGPPQI